MVLNLGGRGRGAVGGMMHAIGEVGAEAAATAPRRVRPRPEAAMDDKLLCEGVDGI